MSRRSRSTSRGNRGFGRVTDVRFMEVEFEAPRSVCSTRMVIEVEGGLRLMVDDESVELAARLLNALGRLAEAPRRKGVQE